MRRAIAVLSVVAIAALAASPAQAGFVYGDYYFQFTIGTTAGATMARTGLGIAHRPDGHHRRSDLDQDGKHLRVGRQQDFNAEIDFKESFTASPGRHYQHLPLEHRRGVGDDVRIGSGGDGYAGYFLGIDGDSGLGKQSRRPFALPMASNGNGIYYVPTDGNAKRRKFELDLKIWLGNYTSFSAAQRPGADVAR